MFLFSISLLLTLFSRVYLTKQRSSYFHHHHYCHISYCDVTIQERKQTSSYSLDRSNPHFRPFHLRVVDSEEFLLVVSCCCTQHTLVLHSPLSRNLYTHIDRKIDNDVSTISIQNLHHKHCMSSCRLPILVQSFSSCVWVHLNDQFLFFSRPLLSDSVSKKVSHASRNMTQRMTFRRTQFELNLNTKRGKNNNKNLNLKRKM